MASTIQIKRGTGSAVPSGLADGELAINLDSGQLYFGSGSTSVNSFRFTNLTADNYTVSSSVTNYVFQTLSGSSDFGDDVGDIHNRTGSLNVSGALNVDGDIKSTNFTTGRLVKVGSDGVLNDSSMFTVTGNDMSLGRDLTIGRNLIIDAGTISNVSTTHITASGNISASGDITALTGSFTNYEGNYLSITPTIQMFGDHTGVDTQTHIKLRRAEGRMDVNCLNGTEKKITLNCNFLEIDDSNSTNTQHTRIRGNITASGNISASGNIIATGNVIADGASFSGTITAPKLIPQTQTTATLEIGTEDNSHPLTNHTIQIGYIPPSGPDPSKAASLVIATNVTASGKISASNTIIAADYAFGDRKFANVSLVDSAGIELGNAGSGNLKLTHLTASGDISSSGNIVGQSVFIDNSLLHNGNTSTQIQFDTDRMDLITDSSVRTRITNDGTTVTNGYLNVNSNITASGNISASGDIITNNLTADSLILTNRIDRVDDAKTGIIFGDGIVVFNHITSSGNISSSGTIFTDTLSSPTNDLTLDSDVVTVGAGTGDATLIIKADTDNSTETDNARLWFKQDGDITEGAIQMTSNVLNIISNISAVGGISFQTGTTNNTGTTDPATGATERMNIASDGTVTVVGNLDLDGNVIGDGATDISGIDTITTSGNISSSGGSIYGETVRINNKRALNESNNVGDLFDGLGSGARINLGKSNVAVSVFTHGNITASGNISSSGNIYGGIYFTNNQRSLYNLAGTLNVGDGVGSVTVPQLTSSGDISSSGEITSNKLVVNGGQDEVLILNTTSTTGNPFIDFSQNGSRKSFIQHNDTGDTLKIASEFGAISFQTATDGDQIERMSISSGGHITASGNISSSGDIIANTGSFNHLIMDDGEFIANIISAKDTDENPSAQINLKDADNNSIAGFARLGSGGNAHIGQVFLRDNANLKVQIKASGDSYFNGSSVQVGIGNDSPGKELDVTGEIRASGNITANGNIVGDNATNISGINHITASGNISSSGTITTSTLVGASSGDTSGSLVLSGSLTFKANVAQPAVSASTVYVHQEANHTANDMDLRFGRNGLTPAFAWVTLDDDGTSTSAETLYGVGSAITSTTHNMSVVHDTTTDGTRIFALLDGIYKVTLVGILQGGSGTTVYKTKVDGSDVHSFDFFVHGSVDPVERTSMYVGSVSSGSYITVTADCSTNVSFEQGSTLMVERMS